MKKENLGTKQELIAWRIEIAMDWINLMAIGSALDKCESTSMLKVEERE